MRTWTVVSLLVTITLGLAASLTAQVPQMKSVAPDSGKVGTVVRVHGIALGRDKVDPNQDLALRAAREGIVLLKNDKNLLPLKKDLKSVAVIGPDAVDEIGRAHV